MPKKTPMTVESVNATSGAHNGKDEGNGVNFASSEDMHHANAIPPTPPAQHNTTDSTRNWFTTSCWRAPTAFLMPISLVRSTTDTNIIFIITIPPTTSDIPTTNSETEKITLVRLLNNSLTPSD